MFLKADCDGNEKSFLDFCDTGLEVPETLERSEKEVRMYPQDPVQFVERMSCKKPNVSYADLIVEAIENSKHKMLTLKEIYNAISTKYPYFSLKKAGWQNSIRHNLSLNKGFYKVPRTPGKSGKGSFWKIDYDLYTSKPNYRSRRFSSRFLSSMYSCNMLSEDYSLLTENTSGQSTFLENIGVTSIESKPAITSIFDGNLVSFSDSTDPAFNFEQTETNIDKNNIKEIFSFK